MKISIVGLGKMGSLVQKTAQEENIEIASSIDPHQKDADFTEIDEESLHGTDVCICFTQPTAALENIEKIASLKKKIVMATTGWEDKLEQAKKIIEQHKTAMIYASNFSIGVNIFFKLVEESAKIINRFGDYDVLGWEMHHNRKLDSPSGTAKTIAKNLIENIQRKKNAVYDRLNRKIEKDEIHFASIRGGDIAGTHTINYESEFDGIELKHTAKNRLGFAKGSLLAARWLMGVEKGFFTEKDLMNYLIR